MKSPDLNSLFFTLHKSRNHDILDAPGPLLLLVLAQVVETMALETKAGSVSEKEDKAPITARQDVQHSTSEKDFGTYQCLNTQPKELTGN